MSPLGQSEAGPWNATCYRCGAEAVIYEGKTWNHSCNSLAGHTQVPPMIHMTRQVFTPLIDDLDAMDPDA